MSIIANWTAIQNLGYTVNGISNYSQCPTKSHILSNSSAPIKGTYASNQLVKLSDIGGEEVYEYFGYSNLTGDNTLDMEQAYNSSEYGKLYKWGSNYYTSNTYDNLVASGVYVTFKGLEGYPYYSDSVFLTIY